MFHTLRRAAACALLLALPCAAAAEDAAPELRTIMGKDAESWLRHLQDHENPEERTLAIFCLREFGPQAAAAVPALLKTAQDPLHADLRRFATDALGCVGPAAKAATAPLLLALKEPQQAVNLRRTIVEALAKIDPADAAVARELVRAAREDNELVRRAGIEGCVTLLLESDSREAQLALKDSLTEPKFAEYAAQAVRPLREKGAALLAEVLQKDREPPCKRAAAEALGRMGADARPAMQALTQAARKDRAPDVKAAAQAALARLASGGVQDPDDPEPAGPPKYAAEALGTAEVAKQLLEARTPDKRFEAAVVLRQRAADAAEAVPALLKALNDPDLKVKTAAARSLAVFRAQAKDALPVLIDWLGTGEAVLQRAALAGLAGIGVESPQALIMLRALAKSGAADDDLEMRDLLGLALRAQGTPAAEFLATALDDDDAKIRVRAARYLRAMGDVGLAAVPKLIEVAGGPDDDAAYAAFDAIGSMGPNVKTVCGDLLAFLQDPRAGRRQHAALALSTLGKDPELGPRIIERLALSLMDPEEDVCRGAHTSLTIIGAPVLPKLREIVKVADETPFWVLRVMARLKADPGEVIPRMLKLTLPGMQRLERANAAELLGYYAPEHPEIIPALARMLGDREKFVARAAEQSLAAFGAAAYPALEAALRSRDPRMRQNAVAALEAAREEALKPRK